MNILMFATRIVYGGGEKVRNWLSNRLVSEGHKVFYAVPCINDQIESELKDVGLFGKVNIVEYPFSLKKKCFPVYLKSIKAIYRDNNIELLVWFGGSLVEQLIAKQMNIKVLLSERGNPASRTLPSRLLKRIQYRVADGYVFQTPEASNFYGKRAKKLSVVIPNPILVDFPVPTFKNLRKEIVSVGRLCPEKNQVLLLNAFNNIKKDIPEYNLVIYGSGPLESKLKKLIEKNDLQNRVKIVKGITNITKHINNSSLFVLPSNSEGMPNALIEAMGMGLLCISTDCPIFGPRLLIKHGVNGFLTPVGNEKKLADIMLYALSVSNATNIRNEASKIREILNADIIFSQWKKYIETIIR